MKLIVTAIVLLFAGLSLSLLPRWLLIDWCKRLWLLLVALSFAEWLPHWVFTLRGYFRLLFSCVIFLFRTTLRLLDLSICTEALSAELSLKSGNSLSQLLIGLRQPSVFLFQICDSLLLVIKKAFILRLGQLELFSQLCDDLCLFWVFTISGWLDMAPAFRLLATLRRQFTGILWLCLRLEAADTGL